MLGSYFDCFVVMVESFLHQYYIWYWPFWRSFQRILYRFIMYLYQVCVINVLWCFWANFSPVWCFKDLIHDMCVIEWICSPSLHMVPHPTLHLAPHLVHDLIRHLTHDPTLGAQASWRLVHWRPVMGESTSWCYNPKLHQTCTLGIRPYKLLSFPGHH